MNCKYVLLWIIVAIFQVSLTATAQEGYPYRQVHFGNVKISDGFWFERLQAHRNGTIPVAIEQVRDSTARVNNFKIAAGLAKGKFQGLVWDDSDLYKVMEGIAYSLQNKREPELEKMMDEWIGYFEKAQREDGYLNTYFILSQEDDGLGRNLGRWSDMGRHEMYCAGHLIEAGVAYEKATGKKNLLEVARKFADNMLNTFGPYKRRWVPLHQESELALVKLYRATNEKKYLDFAHWLLEERGRGREAGPMWDAGPERKYVDCQTDMPVKDMKEAWGHAVRAMYMYSGMLDVAMNLKDSTYLPAVNSIWNNAVPNKVYITGGIGSRRDGEAIGEEHELPNKEAYCETCSSVGMVLWNNRMNLAYGDAKYANVVERTLYNALLAGVSLDGRKVFYTNPLESEGKNHRGEKYGIACCPSNIARFMPSVGNYVYVTRNNELLVNLFVASETELTLNDAPLTITQKTGYPFDGNVALSVKNAAPVNGKIKLLIPEWCESYTVKLNGKKLRGAKMESGYLAIDRKWNNGDNIELMMDMPVRMVASDPQVKNNIGRRAVQRGPLVYCLEEVDNPGVDISTVSLSPKNTFKVVPGDGVLKGINKLQTGSGKNTLTFVPYYAWENRKSGKMIVWTRYAE